MNIFQQIQQKLADRGINPLHHCEEVDPRRHHSRYPDPPRKLGGSEDLFVVSLSDPPPRNGVSDKTSFTTQHFEAATVKEVSYSLNRLV